MNIINNMRSGKIPEEDTVLSLAEGHGEEETIASTSGCQHDGGRPTHKRKKASVKRQQASAGEPEEPALPADDHEYEAADEADAGLPAPANRKDKLEKKLKKLKATYDRRGIVYISRIPPHMKPQKLRQMLSQHGEVSRIYLAPEDPSVRKRRKRMGGNSGKNFSEGWAEFEDKRVAKAVAQQLNGQPMGGKRRSAYHYDLWCLKYLRAFKWDHLTEEIAYQKAVREQKLAAEISAAKRERDFYLSRVDRAKAQAAQQERKRKRQERERDEGGAAPIADSAAGGSRAEEGPAHQRRVLRTYGQKKAKADPASEDAPMLDPAVLALIAGKRK